MRVPAASPVIASEAKQSSVAARSGLLRRGACHRAGHFGPDPLAPRNDELKTEEDLICARLGTGQGEAVIAQVDDGIDL